MSAFDPKRTWSARALDHKFFRRKTLTCDTRTKNIDSDQSVLGTRQPKWLGDGKTHARLIFAW
jgi:hypothetical protein